MYVIKYAGYRAQSSKRHVASRHDINAGAVDINSLPVLSLDGAAATGAESEIGSPNTEDITCLSTSGTVVFTLNGL